MQILSAAKQLPAWGQEPGAGAATLYDSLVKEVDIVRLVLLLTGAITSARYEVSAPLSVALRCINHQCTSAAPGL